MATLEAPVRPRTASHQGPFVNEPFYDFRQEENARKMRAAGGPPFHVVSDGTVF